VAGAVPLTLETRYLLRQGDTGLYVYHKLTHNRTWPDFQLQQVMTDRRNGLSKSLLVGSSSHD
jgi:hypothetical protein